MKVLLKVTPEDIWIGKPRSSEYCPIARALPRCIREQYPDMTPEWVEVNESISIKFSDTTGGKNYKTINSYEELDDFINKFDAGDTVLPFELEIEFEEELMEDEL